MKKLAGRTIGAGKKLRTSLATEQLNSQVRPVRRGLRNELRGTAQAVAHATA
ncbi:MULTISPECIES: hypothetical protein [Pseudomonas]|uniref:hypothetical protein n=1 Tax=Pseudomonas TaxID=286 RepID=UPI000A97D0FA|nr:MULTISPECIES: hypothetical protein [Pseudomonas]MCE0459850.1 hypothetical protein [Pseudomonas uvaldensis]